MKPPSITGMRARPPKLTQQTQLEFEKGNIFKKPFSITRNERVVSRESTFMWDINTPDFKKRQAAGEIVNSPMVKETEVLKSPLVPFSGSVKAGTTDWVTTDGYFSVSPPAFTLKADDSFFSNLRTNAITDAYANISANEGNTLLWIGEMKETISMLFDIGTAVRVLLDKTKKQRVAWAKGKLSVEEVQGLTLQLLYGILPLEQQIADFMDGLFKTKQANSRQTARGYRVKHNTSSRVTRNISQTLFNNNVSGMYDMVIEESVDVTVRAGVLFDVDIDDLPWVSVILDPKAVVSTMYALTRLSFVIDWFINVGGILTAWAPSQGTNILSAWVSVEINHDVAARVIPPVNPPAGKIFIPPVSTDLTRSTTQKWREPISRADLPVLPRLDINLDWEKLAAMVLLFAKIKKTI